MNASFNSIEESTSKSKAIRSEGEDEVVFIGGCSYPVAVSRSELPKYLDGYRFGFCICAFVGLACLVIGSLGFALFL